jgi:tetratricopeptide (TPR) repeat protein
MCPSRTRSHQLETESDTAFRAAVPSNWVFRRKSDDYGIDGEVEIFDPIGKATGELFLVQLKATDETDLRKALRLRLRKDVAQYYASLPLPLLLVRYHAPTRQLYFTWFHALDLYYARKSRLTVSFALREADKWTDTSAHSIEQTVAAYRHAMHPSPRLPFEFSVIIENDRVYGIARYELQARLKRSAERVRRLVTLRFDAISANDPNRIEISDDGIAVRLANMPVLTVHTAKDSFAGVRLGALPEDILLMVGLGLDRAGHSALGAALLEATQFDSIVAKNLDIGAAIARCFSRAGRAVDALRIAERLMNDAAYIPVAHVYLMVLASGGAYGVVAKNGLSILERIAASLAERGYNEAAAALHYTCANSAGHCGRYSKAMYYYRRARRLDPTYTQRGYYQRELGAASFLMGRFRAAVFHYRHAMQLNNDRSTQLRLADALLFSGEYQRAQAMFAEAFEHGRDLSDAEWILKSMLIPRIIAAAGQPNQIRRRNALSRGFDPRSMAEDEIRSVCNDALRIDALCALAWFNLGGVAQRARDAEAALHSFLIAALLNRGDMEAWANAVGITINAKKFISQHIEDADAIAVLAVAAGYIANGEDFVMYLAERVAQGQRESFVDMIRQFVSEIPKADDARPILRVRSPDGTWHQYPRASPQKPG